LRTTRLASKYEVSQPAEAITTIRPSGLGTASPISVELGAVISVLTARVVGFRLSTRLEHELARGTQGPAEATPPTGPAHRGPLEKVSSTGPPPRAAGTETDSPVATGTLATVPTRRPVLSEN